MEGEREQLQEDVERLQAWLLEKIEEAERYGEITEQEAKRYYSLASILFGLFGIQRLEKD